MLPIFNSSISHNHCIVAVQQQKRAKSIHFYSNKRNYQDITFCARFSRILHSTPRRIKEIKKQKAWQTCACCWRLCVKVSCSHGRSRKDYKIISFSFTDSTTPPRFVVLLSRFFLLCFSTSEPKRKGTHVDEISLPLIEFLAWHARKVHRNVCPFLSSRLIGEQYG
uniref:Uncharacterized protein n=1 Tax=Anopheles arabiensis TaxID=7173 RepID=A0A182IG94_ANOAR